MAGEREAFGGLRNALAKRDYRLYVMGHVAHTHGWWTNRVGLGGLAWQLSESPQVLGLVGFASMLPVMFVGPLGGAMGDRYGHRLVAALSGFSNAAVTAAIGILALTGGITVPMLIMLCAVQGAVFGVEFPARQALIPQLAGRENIAAAVAFNSTTFHVGGFIGPVIAGLIFSLADWGAVILVYGGTSLWMVLMLSLMHHANPLAPGRGETSLFGDLWEGVIYVAGHPALRLLIAGAFTIGLLIRPYNELLAGFAGDVFGMPDVGLAPLTAAAGVGALLGAALMMMRSRNEGMTVVMLGGGFLAAAFVLFFASVETFDLALGLLAVGTFGIVLANVGWNSLVQHISDPRMRGRAISILVSLSVGAPALGSLAIGSLAEVIGLQRALGLSCIAAIVVLAALAVPLLRGRAGMEADRES